MNEFWAALGKEARVEFRARHGLLTTMLFGVLALTAISFASFGQAPSPDQAAGALSAVLLFAAVISLPRAFLVEDEQGTFDTLRLWARPEVAYLAKMAFAAGQMLVTSLPMGALFSVLSRTPVERPGLFVAGLLLFGAALAAGSSLCGALSLGARNRWVLASVVSLPLLLPTVALGVGVFRVAFGAGSLGSGLAGLAGLAGFALALLSGSPWLVRAVWRLDQGGPSHVA